MGVVKAANLGDAVADLSPACAEALGQLLAELGLENVARRLGVFVDRRVVEASPLAVRSLGGVGDEDVDVNLGIAVSRGAMTVASGEEAVAPDELGVGSAPRPASLPLEVAERGIEGSSASVTAALVSASPKAQSREADLGTEKVRSKPGTAPRPPTARRPSGSPVAGLRPVSIAVSWSASTAPSRPRSLAASPSH